LIRTLRIPLKEILFDAIAGTIHEQQLNEFIRLIRSFTVPFIHRKVRTGKLSLDYVGLRESDVVTDCIAELFQRNEQNQLIQLAAYFERQHIEIAHCSEEKLLMELRRLTLRIASDNLFRLYNEIDPALSKIIRNIKLAVENSTCFAKEEFLGETVLVLLHCEPLLQNISISDEELAVIIEANMEYGDDIPVILSRFVEYWKTQEVYQRKVRLISLAVAIKTAYETFHCIGEEKHNDAERSFFVADVKQMIGNVCVKLRDELQPRYEAKGKVSKQEFHNYFAAIAYLLNAEFLDGERALPSHYERLNEIFPELTREEYARKHRVVFEYLVKRCRTLVKEKLKEIVF